MKTRPIRPIEELLGAMHALGRKLLRSLHNEEQMEAVRAELDEIKQELLVHAAVLRKHIPKETYEQILNDLKDDER